ncbi:MAG TPA: acyl-CoA dehydrogenase family protein [Candidatus Udaeobacter sp.]|nr:acyl-CoA dehydrogenase family protein [Candidatus Udaeobacter sp.]
MNKLDAQRQKEIQQAEELLFAGPQALGFAKGLFQGHFVADWVMPYPRIPAAQQDELNGVLTELRQFLDERLDPAEVDRKADIPRSVIDGLGRVGVLGLTAPKEYGGHGFSQMANCQILEEIGRRCASTSVFVNAHHSIGIRALLLFGTHEQKQRWLPKLSTGEQLGAFALTEREAGSDAANVQMQARPSEDGSHFVLNGEKRYITNAAIADVLTVMARTPVPGSDKTSVTAFLVTPDMPGFEMLDARMPKMGIRGTATGRFALRDVKVPRENILGPLGKGLKVALTVLDFGRTTFGACCTGAAKTCLRLAIEHANTRKQFNKTLGNFHLVQKKIARIAADAYAMEAMTTITAALIDRGLEDYMLETAMLKVFTTERLWECINDVFQIYGGSAYFVDLPLERMMRDARINQIGEGANEVLTSFVALVGMRGPGMEFKEIYDTMMKPTRERGIAKAWAAGKQRLGATVRVPEIPVRSAELRWFANQLGRLIWRFNVAVNRALITYREPILDMQLVQERIANTAMDLFASTCVLSRHDADLQLAQRNGSSSSPDRFAADLFLRQSFRRIRHFLAGLTDNDDKCVLATAKSVLGKPES